MAGLNEMQTGQRLQTALAQRYGIQSPVAPALATEVFPTIEVSSQGIDPELQFLQGTILGIGLGIDPGVVAQQSHVGLENPANSGLIAIIETIWIMNTTGANGNFWLRIEGGSLVAADFTTAGWQRDSRFGATKRTACNIVTLTGVVAPGNGVWQTRIPNQETGVVRFPFILGPQSRVWCHVDGGDNEEARVAFTWRERAIEQWELTGAV